MLLQSLKRGRDDLAAENEQEIAILERYLPEQLSDEELAAIVRQAVKEVNAASLRDMGKVMGRVMPQVKGKADGTRVQAAVKEILQ